jgi:hypothetical protein
MLAILTNNRIIINQYLEDIKKYKSTVIQNGKVMATFPYMIDFTDTKWSFTEYHKNNHFYILKSYYKVEIAKKAKYDDGWREYYGLAKDDGTIILEPNEFNSLSTTSDGHFTFFTKYVNEYLPDFSTSFKLYLVNKNECKEITAYKEVGTFTEEFSFIRNIMVKKDDKTGILLADGSFKEKAFVKRTFDKTEEIPTSNYSNTMSEDFISETAHYINLFDNVKSSCLTFQRTKLNSAKKDLYKRLDEAIASIEYIVIILERKNDNSIPSEERHRYRNIAQRKFNDLIYFRQQLNEGVYTDLDVLLYKLNGNN